MVEEGAHLIESFQKEQNLMPPEGFEVPPDVVLPFPLSAADAPNAGEIQDIFGEYVARSLYSK